MSFWSRLFRRRSASTPQPQRLDYLNEGLALERQGDFDAAITSYRLALRDNPKDLRVLQNIAIAYSKTHQYDEAIRYYQRALQVDPDLAGAHYGVAFLLLKRGEREEGISHLRAFLAKPPRGSEGKRWVDHARQTLDDLTGQGQP